MSIKTPECNSLAEIITYPWSLAVDHCEKAAQQADYQWVHYTLAALEYIPVIGALVALVELVALSILSCFLTASATPASTQPKRPWKFVPSLPLCSCRSCYQHSCRSHRNRHGNLSPGGCQTRKQITRRV